MITTHATSRKVMSLESTAINTRIDWDSRSTRAQDSHCNVAHTAKENPFLPTMDTHI